MKLIVFDFDGTLVDSRKLIIESHRIIFGEFGLAAPSEAQSLSLIGMSLELVLKELAGPDAPVERMSNAYRQLLPRLRADAAFVETPFEDAADLLAELARDQRFRLGIATGHVAHAITPMLDELGWRDLFCTVQTADRAPSKPHPGMLQQALAESGVAASEAIMIGDTAFDMEMAQSAGIDAVGVSWGYHQPERLIAAGAGRVVNHMKELRDFLFAL